MTFNIEIFERIRLKMVKMTALFGEKLNYLLHLS